jgi:hypothetical protein
VGNLQRAIKIFVRHQLTRKSASEALKAIVRRCSVCRSNFLPKKELVGFCCARFLFYCDFFCCLRGCSSGEKEERHTPAAAQGLPLLEGTNQLLLLPERENSWPPQWP